MEDILICPQTKSRITIDVVNDVARVEGADIFYPIEDGIIDFLPGVNDRISESYDYISSSYDDYGNLSSLKWKLFALIVWGFLDDTDVTQRNLSSIPEDFDGVLLDVPVGTGIATADKYSRLENARIIAVDYSWGMLRKAQQRYASTGIRNATFIRADVANLPIERASIDFCLSMAGFHAFSNKAAALSEIARVLRAEKIFAGCFYIKGKRILTDVIVKCVLSRLGYFTAPFFNEAESLSMFSEYFDVNFTATLKSGFVFEMNRKQEKP